MHEVKNLHQGLCNHLNFRLHRIWDTVVYGVESWRMELVRGLWKCTRGLWKCSFCFGR